MKINLFIFLMLFAIKSIAQNTFIRFYNKDNNYKLSFDRGIKLLEVKDGYIIMGFKSEDEESITSGTLSFQDTTRPMFIKIDKKGNVLWNKRYNNNTCNFSTANFIKNLNNEYISVGNTLTSGDTCLFLPNPPIVDNQVYIQKINDFGDLIWQKNIGESITKSSQTAYDISATKDGNYFIIAEDELIQWLIKINENGDTLWTKKYTNLYNKTPKNIVSISDGYLITYEDNSIGSSRILKINEQGDSIWIKTLSSFYATNIKPTTDGNFILQNNSSPSTLLKIDKDANEIWRKTYNLNASFGFCLVNNDEFIICNKDFSKVDSDGAILWNKRYFGINNINPWYFIHDVIQTSDEGFLSTGFYDGDTFVIKTDCNGNIEWDTNSCLLTDEADILIFPNPFNDLIIIQVPSINKIDDNVTIKITNVLGQNIFSSEYSNQNIFTLNTSQFSQGVYIYSVMINSSIFKSGKIVKQ